MILNKIPNRLENLIIVIVVALITYGAVIFLRVKPMEAQFNKQLDSRDKIIIDLAEIAKYNYEINNSFGKMKPKGSQIIIDLNNKLNALNTTSLDTIPTRIEVPVKKKGFFKRIFN